MATQFLSFIRSLRQSRFVVNLATLSVGTVVAQAIPVVATVILSRLYTPEEMGEWGVFSGYASILAIMGSLRYEGAIVKAKEKADAYCLSYISILFSLLFTLLLYVVAILFSVTGAKIGLEYGIMYFLPLYILTLLLVQVLTNLSTYLRKYKLIASNSINRSIGQTISRIIFGFLKSNRQGMIHGAIVGNIISLITLGRSLKIRKNIGTLRRDRAMTLIRENKNFPKYDLPSNLLNSVSSHCPPILLSYFFLDTMVGLFSMAQNLLYLPMSIVGTAVSQLYYKDASEAFHQGKPLSLLTRRLFLSMYCGGVVFMCLLIICESWLFGVVLGSRWYEVGKYAVLLSPWLLMVTSISPLSTVFYVKGKQDLNMFLNCIGMFMRVASIIVVASLFSQNILTVFSFGLASTLFYVIQGYYVLKLGEMSFCKKDYIYLVGMTSLFVVLYVYKVLSYL